MTIIYIIIVGGVLGWLASIMMRTDAEQGMPSTEVLPTGKWKGSTNHKRDN